MTLDDIMALCVGTIGMGIDEFYNSTYREISCVLHGYSARMQDHLRATWQQTRLMCYYSLVPHVKKGTLATPESFMPFPWEQNQDVSKVMIKDTVTKKDLLDRMMLQTQQLNQDLHLDSLKNEIKRKK